MSDKAKNILILICYFLLAVVLLSSIGIWLPVLIDIFNKDKVSEEVMHSLPGNILTYALGLFLIAIIDRSIYLLFKTSQYQNNILEFFVIAFIFLITSFFVFCSLKSLKGQYYIDAHSYAKYVMFISWGAWLYVKFRGTKDSNYSAIGGVI